MSRQLRVRRVLTALLLGLVAGVLALFVASRGLGRDLEDRTYDLRLRSTARPAEARPDIALVLINESSLRALEPVFGAWPWPRIAHAGVIDFLHRAGARVIAYDVLFLDHDRRTAFEVAGRQMSGAESDGELIAAVRRAGNVVLLADAAFEGMAGDNAADEAPRLPGVRYAPGPGFGKRPVRLPFAELADAAAGIGHNFAVKEGVTGTARRMWPFVDAAGVAVPSLGLEAALLAAHVSPDRVQLDGDALRIDRVRMPLTTDPVPVRADEPPASTRQVMLNFRGPYANRDGTTTYPVYSFFNVLLSEDRVESGDKPPIDPSAFRDKIVFVGTSADGLSDIWASPFEGAGMPGVQLHAALADDVLSGRFMRRAPSRVDSAVTIVAGLAGGLLAILLPVGWAVAAVAIVGAAVVGWLTHEIRVGVWIAMVAPIGALAIAAFEGVAWQYFVEGREKRRVKSLFGRYVSKDVFEHLMADPAVATLGGQRREMTVLFCDIRGFTAASERGEPEAIVQQLNEYFTAMVDVLFRHQGTVDKFIGDMVMALFGAPVLDARHADHAVAAACEMSSVLERLNEGWQAAGRPVLDIGIGVNSGEMIAGNIGSETIMSYTVIGDAVNLGSRIESLNKEYGTRILISEDTRRRLTEPVEIRRIGDVVVKGRTQAVTIYEVLAKGKQ